MCLNIQCDVFPKLRDLIELNLRAENKHVLCSKLVLGTLIPKVNIRSKEKERDHYIFFHVDKEADI